MVPEEIDTRFTYHPPHGDQPQRYEVIRDAARDFAELINELTPRSREQSLAFTALDEVVMWANAAIARREEPDAVEEAEAERADEPDLSVNHLTVPLGCNGHWASPHDIEITHDWWPCPVHGPATLEP